MPVSFDAEKNQIDFGASIYHTTIDGIIGRANMDRLADVLITDDKKPVPHATGLKLKAPAGGYTAEDLNTISAFVTQVDKYVEQAAAPKVGRKI